MKMILSIANIDLTVRWRVSSGWDSQSVPHITDIGYGSSAQIIHLMWIVMVFLGIDHMFRPRIDDNVYKTNDKKERESRLSRCVNNAHGIAMDSCLWGVFRVYENVEHTVLLVLFFSRVECYLRVICIWAEIKVKEK